MTVTRPDPETAPKSEPNPGDRRLFRALADQWYRETGLYSLTTQKIGHPAYTAILSLGPLAVPLILEEMKNGKGHWFGALRDLTGQNPVPENDRGYIDRMRARWLEWGRSEGYDV